jgi:hypothetical protein
MYYQWRGSRSAGTCATGNKYWCAAGSCFSSSERGRTSCWRPTGRGSLHELFFFLQNRFGLWCSDVKQSQNLKWHDPSVYIPDSSQSRSQNRNGYYRLNYTGISDSRLVQKIESDRRFSDMVRLKGHVYLINSGSTSCNEWEVILWVHAALSFGRLLALDKSQEPYLHVKLETMYVCTWIWPRQMKCMIAFLFIMSKSTDVRASKVLPKVSRHLQYS